MKTPQKQSLASSRRKAFAAFLCCTFLTAIVPKAYAQTQNTQGEVTQNQTSVSFVDFKKTRPDEDLLLFSLNLGRTVLFDTLLTYEDLDTGKYYLPLSDVVQALEFPIEVDNDSGRASGWFLQETRDFSLDLNAARVTVDGNDHMLLPEEVELHEDGIYVSIEMLESWFPLTIDVDFSELALVLKSTEPLPVEIRLAREEKRGKISEGKKNKRTQYPLDDIKPPLFSLPFIDTNIQYAHEKADSATDSSRVSATTLASGIILGHDFEASINDDTASDQPPDIRARFGLKNPNGDMFNAGISEYSFGDVYTDTISLIASGGAGRGVSLSTYNLDNLQSEQAGTARLRGDLPEGYQIDVVRNGQLVGFLEQPDDNGEYIFDLDVLPGLNVFELVFYGPHGQKETREERIFVPVNAVKKGAFDFKASVIQDGTNLFTNRSTGTDKDIGNYRINMQAEYGLSDISSLYAGLTTLTLDGKRNNYALLRYSRSFDALRTDWTYARSDKSQGDAIGLRLQTIFKGISLQAQHNYFNNFISEQTESSGIQGVLTHQTNFRMSGAVAFLGSVPFSFNLTRLSNLESHERYDWQVRATKNLGKLRMTAEVSQRIEDGIDRDTDANLQFSSRFEKLILRGNMNYAIEPDAELRNIVFNADWGFSKDSILRFGFQRSGADDPLQTYSFGYSHIFDNLKLGFNMNYNDQDEFRAFVNTSFSLGYDSKNNDFIMRQEQMAGSALFIPNVYFDENGNNIRDENEAAVKGVTFTGEDIDKKAMTNEDGYVVLTGAEPYTRSTLALNNSSLADPYLRSKNKPRDYVLRPSQIVHKDFPVILVGETDGEVYIVKQGKKKEAQSISVQIMKGEELISESTSEFDGFYWIQDIPMGEYAARPDPKQIEELGYCMPKPQEVTLTPDEPFYSLNPFILWPTDGSRVVLAENLNQDTGEAIWEDLKREMLVFLTSYDEVPNAYLIQNETGLYDLVIHGLMESQINDACSALEGKKINAKSVICKVRKQSSCAQNFISLATLEIKQKTENEGALNYVDDLDYNDIRDLTEQELEAIIDN